jgi:hypothetical protein
VNDIVHKDIIGRDLHPGDYVAYSQHGFMWVGTVSHNTPKRVQVDNLKSYPWSRSTQIPDRVVKLENSADLTAYVLKESK